MTDACRQGVLALGDSITNGGGELQWGVALQSWTQWLARGLGLPLTNHAVDGATARDVCERQIRAHEHRSARPDAHFEVGCLYIGVNDVRGPHWDPLGYARHLNDAMAWLTARCDRTLVCTLPLGLGRPPAGDKVVEANSAIRQAAGGHGALVIGLEGFGARNHVMVDRVHPTAFGQVAIAERALAVLAADGVATRVRPSELLSYETTRWGRLRGDATYAYRQVKAVARDALALGR